MRVGRALSALLLLLALTQAAAQAPTAIATTAQQQLQDALDATSLIHVTEHLDLRDLLGHTLVLPPRPGDLAIWVRTVPTTHRCTLGR